MATENPETLPQESPLASTVPLQVRLTEKQRKALIFLAFAIPLWIVLALLAVASHMMMFALIGGLFLLVLIYGMKTEYLLFLWLAVDEFAILLKYMGLSLGGIGVKGLFFIAVLTQLPNKFSLMPRRLFRTVPLRWLFYLLLAWAFVSLPWFDKYRFWNGYRLFQMWLVSFLVYAMVFLTVNDQNKRKFFLIFAVITGSSVFFGLLQRFGLGISLAGLDPIFAPTGKEAVGDYAFRATGFTGHPNALGRQCVLEFLVLLMMLMVWRPKAFWRWVILCMLGVTIAVTVLSYSRVAWGLFAAGVIAFLAFTRPRWLLALVPVIAFIAIVGWAQIHARIAPVLSGTDASLSSREYATRIYMEYWKHRPITGYGLGSTGGGAQSIARIIPHEGYVFLLVYLGVVGFLLYVSLVLALLKKTWRAVHDRFVRTDPELYAMTALGLGVAVAAVALNFVVGVELSLGVWYLIAASFAALRIARKRSLANAPLPAVETPSD